MSQTVTAPADRVAKHVRDIRPSGIRVFFEMVLGMKDVISLGVGEPDFRTPQFVRDYAKGILDQGITSYTSNWGLMELREALATWLEKKYGVSYDPKSEILITVGGSEAIDISLRGLLNPGDEAIVVEPCYVSYVPSVVLAGGKPVILPVYQKDNFRIDYDRLRSLVTPRTRCLLINYPSNPTGATLRREDLDKLAAFAKDHDLMVLTDEIYAELTYEGKHVSLAALPGMKNNTMLISGFSKAFAMTGWRIGYICGPSEILNELLKIHQYAILCAPTLSQFACIEALKKGEDDIVSMRAEYDRRRRYITDRFNGMGLKTLLPEGAFYSFASIESTGMTSDEFCRALLKAKNVAIVPGSAFGDCGEGMVRASYCNSLEKIELAMNKLEEFLKTL